MTYLDDLTTNYLESILPTVEVLEAISRLSSRNYYIIDLLNEEFVYISDNTKQLFGRTAFEIQNLGFKFFAKHLQEKDHTLLTNVKFEAERFLEEIPIENRKNYTLYKDINFINHKDKVVNLINHQFTPLTFRNESIHLCLCMTSICANQLSEKIEIWHKDKKQKWSYVQDNNQWHFSPKIQLRNSEKEVIRLSAQGLTITEIADKMNKSLDTIKYYRKTIFKKLEVDNITEALARALCQHLL